jgi:hypothetical protein
MDLGLVRYASRMQLSELRSNEIESLHEPSKKDAAPTELVEAKRAGCYKDGAPTELFKLVHGPGRQPQEMQSPTKP